ncbi:MAG: single-stranded-DNA-specific exonuclease RecJ [Francisellaceae bacterium]
MTDQYTRPLPIIRTLALNQIVFNHLLDHDIDAFVASIVARRVSDPDQALNALQLSLSNLSSPFLMKDMGKATDRLVQALVNQEVIGIETDHDCDGQTSHAILFEALSAIFGHPESNIRSYIGHRLKEGYGLSKALTQRILADEIKPSLIITADNGSTDELQIALLKQQGIDTIVTDHHAIPHEGVPKSAVAVLNPTQSGCGYGDPFIAGCMVAWLFMAATRSKLKQQKLLPESAIQLSDLLDFVAVGTVADCVSMSKSLNNRIVAGFGMKRIAQQKRKCWKAFAEHFHKDINSELLGFIIAPLLNSDGRLSDALSSVSFLLSKHDDEVYDWVEFLSKQNNERKAVQRQMTDKAMSAAASAYMAGRKSICVYLDDGHAGVHGISASRIKDAFGLPTILFSPKMGEDEIITGSARSIDGLNIKHMLDEVANTPDIIVKYGGHTGAAGLTIYKPKFDEFYALFDQYVKVELKRLQLAAEPVIYTEGALKRHEITLDTVDKIAKLEPFGRQFEAPVFCNTARISSLRFVGKSNEHLQMRLTIEGILLKAIWFFAHEFNHANDFAEGDEVSVVYRLDKECFKDRLYLSAKVVYIEPSGANA